MKSYSCNNIVKPSLRYAHVSWRKKITQNSIRVLDCMYRQTDKSQLVIPGTPICQTLMKPQYTQESVPLSFMYSLIKKHVDHLPCYQLLRVTLNYFVNKIYSLVITDSIIY